MWEDKIWKKVLTRDDGYNLMIKEYHLNRNDVKFNYDQFFMNKPETYLINMSNDEIKENIDFLYNCFECSGSVKAWIEIFNLELLYKRKEKILKLKNTLKEKIL